MKFLLDSEILEWNKRLSINTNYQVLPRYHSSSSAPLILIKQIINNAVDFTEVITLDPTIEFRFSFSVAKNRIDNFWNIFNNWYSKSIGNKHLYQAPNNSEKIYDIDVTDSIIDSRTEIEHQIYNKDYIRYTYNFKGKLTSIMAYVMFLEDSIDIFSTIWGYDESGSEHNLIKFQIGTVVSKVDDKSKDYIILDLIPKKTDRKFFLNYQISEVISVGEIIRYGHSQIVSESEICFSRNWRIDDILEN